MTLVFDQKFAQIFIIDDFSHFFELQILQIDVVPELFKSAENREVEIHNLLNADCVLALSQSSESHDTSCDHIVAPGIAIDAFD